MRFNLSLRILGVGSVLVLIFSCVRAEDRAPATMPGVPSRLEVLGGGGMAPCTVFVNATGVKLAAGSVLTARYEWDFGDKNAPYNTLIGWNAGHIYDRAGSYTITLHVTDEAGTVTTLTTPVDVAPDKRHRVYVSASGSDTATGRVPEEAIRSIPRALKFLGPDTEILFHAGDTFPGTSEFVVPSSNVVIGAYGLNPEKGGTDRPRFAFPATKNQYMIHLREGQAQDVVVQDISFDSAVGPDYLARAGVRLAGPNNTVRRCEFLNVDTAIGAMANCKAVLIQDNSAPLEAGMHANFLWGTGSDFVLLGNMVANSTREHCMRFAGVDRVLIAHNDLTNLDRRAVDKDDYNKKTLVLQNGTYFYISQNKLTDGFVDVGTAVSGSATTGTAHRGPASLCHWTVLEANTISKAKVNVEPNTQYFMCRNNTITFDRTIFEIRGRDPRAADRVTSDVTIVNNTAVTTGDGGNFVSAGEGATGVTLVNNVYVKRDGKCEPIGMLQKFKTENVFAKISNNVWPTRSKMIDGAGDADVLEDVQLDAGFSVPQNSKAATAAKPFPGVCTDLYDNPRAGDHWSAGATIGGAVQVVPVRIIP